VIALTSKKYWSRNHNFVKDISMSPAKPKTKTDQSVVEELSYEQALSELEEIVASLEANKLPLEESMKLYERGQALTKRCLELLNNAELRIRQLSGEIVVDLPREE
jgi:exodeoxyribonuclease VII small subunit